MQSIGNLGNQLAIMLIKTTATAPVGLGGLGRFGDTDLWSVACTLYIVHCTFFIVQCPSLHRFHDAIDLTDKTDRTKEG